MSPSPFAETDYWLDAASVPIPENAKYWVAVWKSLLDEDEAFYHRLRPENARTILMNIVEEVNWRPGLENNQYYNFLKETPSHLSLWSIRYET
jgi:hypothetical protein